MFLKIPFTENPFSSLRSINQSNMVVLFPIPFRESTLSLMLLLLLVPFSSSFTSGSQPKFSAIRLPSEADPCATSPRPNSCPVNCFRADPVCGDDGVTYWCGCADAHCAGAKVAKIGFCEESYHFVWMGKGNHDFRCHSLPWNSSGTEIML
ncbi:uncharacterized protein LOC111279834 [Durio zibethinus]|uniref:Uncharacterized protein LOC111279834 n=1 Tax=Durio zibethinus TaxID=66656 RepID=A0A6P5X367_DURZI|nr:uncharacterized protein LOC111279834 [Durio zibethinus]